MRTLKLTFLLSVCAHLVVAGVLLVRINFRRRRVPASVHSVRVVEARSEVPSVSKPAEASEVKTEKSAEKVKLDASEKKKKEDKKKLEEFLKKRRRIEELRKERERELDKERKKKDEELKKLTRWSKDVSDRRTLEELKLDSGVVVFPAWYIDEVHNRIFSRWEAPSAGGRSGARVGFDISSAGAISSVVVEKSSGNSVFDFSCESAIRDASPFPSLPKLFKGDRVRVHVTFKEE